MPPSARGQRGPSRDPLTTLFSLALYPLFFGLFSILHIVYYLWLKLVASVQWQRYVYSQARQHPRQLFKRWTTGHGLQRAGILTAEEASEDRLLRRGNRVRSQGRLVAVEGQTGSMKRQVSLAPRHLALVLAAKPVRTRVLLLRVLAAALRGNKRQVKGQSEEEERGQIKFAMDSVQTALRCCALTGVEEVSIYDEVGRVKRALAQAGQSEWILEWPLSHDWVGSVEEETPSYEFGTPRSDSFSSSTVATPRSFSSALDATPSLSKEPSSVSLLDGLCERIDEDPFLSAPPRLRLCARLHWPASGLVPPKKVGAPIRSRLSSHDSVSHAQIKVNLLDAEDAKGALARAASTIAARRERPRVVEVKTIEGVLQGEMPLHSIVTAVRSHSPVLLQRKVTPRSRSCSSYMAVHEG